MNVTKLIVRVGVVALFASVRWLMVGSSAMQKVNTVKSTKANKEKVAKYASKLDEDKYYSVHPYVRKAKEMNEVNLYDITIFYYKKASANFER